MGRKSMAFMIIFYLVAYFAIFGYLVVSAVKNYKRGKKRTAKGFAFLICIFAYFTFHFLFFEFGTLNDDTKWQYRVKNDSSVENPQILFEFQKLYVKDVINPREFVFDCHSSSEYFIYGGVETKNSGYKFKKCLVPSGVKADVFISSEHCFDIVLHD